MHFTLEHKTFKCIYLRYISFHVERFSCTRNTIFMKIQSAFSFKQLGDQLTQSFCPQVSYLGVDTLMNRCPPLVKDLYYDSEDLILPYTEAAAAYKKKTYRGSVANMT